MKPREIAVLIVVVLLLAATVGYLAIPLLPRELWEKEQPWPAWVQAIGSVLAILVAVLVPYVQRRSEMRAASSAADAAAAVVAATVSVQLNHANGLLMTVQKLGQSAEESTLDAIHAAKVLQLLDAMPFPSQEDTLLVAPVLPECAKHIARALGLIETAKSHLKVVDPVTGESAPMDGPVPWSLVIGCLKAAKTHVKQADALLRARFLPPERASPLSERSTAG